MRITRYSVVFDAADLAAESAFWARMFGGTVRTDDDWHSVVVDGVTRVGVQLAPDHVPPEWPDGAPQQAHLDLWVDDIVTAHEEVLALGGRLLKAAEDDPDETERFQVYADPAGHPFCLVWTPEAQGNGT